MPDLTPSQQLSKVLDEITELKHEILLFKQDIITIEIKIREAEFEADKLREEL